MNAVSLTLWSLAALLAVYVYRRKGAVGVRRGLAQALGQARDLMIRLPLALLAAAFLAQVIPTEGVGAVLGPDTGMSGILLASVIGGVMPGGPMTSFPIALIVWQSGAGTAQTVAFLAGWSVFALHRVLAYEAPLMGWRFSGLRLASCFFLPPLAGVLAAAGLWAARSLGLSFAP